MITDHKPLVVIFQERCGEFITQIEKNTAKYSSILHNNPVQPGPQLFTANRLSRHNHEVNSNEEILGCGIAIKVKGKCMDTLDSMTVEEIELVTLDNDHIRMLSEYVQHGWPSTKAEVQKKLHPY